jgi:hypothetical protein
MYDELVAYKEVNGDCDVPKESGPLGSWCGTVRQSRKKGKLNPERIAQLDAIGFCWNTLAAAWDENMLNWWPTKKFMAIATCLRTTALLDPGAITNGTVAIISPQIESLSLMHRLLLAIQGPKTYRNLNMAFPPVDLVNPGSEGVECFGTESQQVRTDVLGLEATVSAFACVGSCI